MANYAIPNWIQPPESLAGRYLQGIQIGNEIQNQRAQLAEAQNRFAINASIQQQQLQQQALAQQQRLEVEKAYHNQLIDLQQQQLKEVEQVNAVKTQQAARQFQAQQAFQQRVASGEDPADVLMQLGPQMGMHAGDMGAILRSRKAGVVPPPEVQNIGGQDWLLTHRADGGYYPPQRVNKPDNQASMLERMVTMDKIKDLEGRRKALEARMFGAPTAELAKPEKKRTKADQAVIDSYNQQKAQLDDLNKQLEDLRSKAVTRRYKHNSDTGKIEEIPQEDTTDEANE